MIATELATAHKWFLNLANKLTGGSYWLVKVTIVATLISLFLAFPSYEQILNGKLGGTTWNAVMAKSNDLTFNVLKLGQFGIGNNAARVNFRLTVPLVAHVFGLSITGIFMLQTIFGVVLLALCAWLSQKIAGSRIVGLLMALLIGGLQAGITSFGEMRGLFDGIALTFLILGLLAENPVLMGSFTLVAAWTDERAILASAFLILFHTLKRKYPSAKATADGNQKLAPRINLAAFLNSATLAVIIGLGVYAASRIAYAEMFNIPQTLGGVGLEVFLRLVNQIPLGLLWAFKGGWLVIGLAAITLIKFRERLFLLFFVSALLLILSVAFFTEDISRSTSFALPGVFVALLVLMILEEKQAVETYLSIATITTLLIPSYYIGSKSALWQYPFPAQLVRWILLSRGVDLS